MKDVYADPTCFEGIKCTGLTKLSIAWEQNLSDDMAKLVEHLPALKVITFVYTLESFHIGSCREIRFNSLSLMKLLFFQSCNP